MLNPYTKLKLRHNVKRTQRGARRVQEDTARQLDKHVIRRWQRFQEIRRFVLSWLLLVAILGVGVVLQRGQLSAYYQTELSAPGGVYIEGIVGQANNFNPIFSTSPVDTSVSKLVFSGLLSYDEDNRLTGDLAKAWNMSENGREYQVELRDDAYWHDGQPVTSQDVVFTFKTVQHPDAQSPLNASWQGITVKAENEKRVTFSLPNPFTPFPYSLTTGILPKHVFDNVQPREMRSHEFNLNPTVGSGPFRFSQAVKEKDVNQIELAGNESYHLGKPQLNQFILRIFEDNKTLISAFEDDELTAIADLREGDKANFENQNDIQYFNLPLYNAVYTFFKHSNPVLNDPKIRIALTHATNRNEIYETLNHRFTLIDGPLLRQQLGYSSKTTQYQFDLDRAKVLLDEAGWKTGDDGIRIKDGNRLELSLVTQDSDEYPAVADMLQRQWRAAGIEIKTSLVDSQQLQQNHVIPHNFEILLLGVSLGVDPDVYVYWHSSQAIVRGFNLSEYKSYIADAALEAGRTRSDNTLRATKYETFQDQWRQDAPAISLYRPAFGYVVRKNVAGLVPKLLPEAEERYTNVHNWTVNKQTVDKLR